MPIINNSYHLISLGCAKNLVDSNTMAQLLDRKGLTQTDLARKAQYLIVNTCGFIESSRQEALAVLSDLSKQKKPGQKLIAAGCMSQRYQLDMFKLIPGIDGLLGTRRWMDILEVISQIATSNQNKAISHFPAIDTMGKDENDTYVVAIQGKSSYLKIADGCRRNCAFCAIPLIKGSLVSRPIKSILRDAQFLEQQGIHEINLIAQDVTDYGRDFGLKDGIYDLIRNILKETQNVPWIRLLYTFPGFDSSKLIDLMAENPRVLPYLDIPLQHADPQVLKLMHRPSDINWVKNTIHEFRNRLPGVAIRTTFIVGYPSETEKAFQNLLDFVKETKFDHLGAFTYSHEFGTPADPLGNPISEKEKTLRLETLMEEQAEISLRKNQSLIGKTYEVLVEGVDVNKQILVGRTYRDAPEVDGLVIIEGNSQVGEMIQAKVTGALEHDLIAQKV